MDISWKEVIARLKAEKWSIAAISRAVGLSTGAIQDLKNGKTKQPKGAAAVKLWGLVHPRVKAAPKRVRRS